MSAEFVSFLDELVDSVAPRKQIQIIADNLSAHKTQAVTAFLSDHPNVHLQYTKNYYYWLNQVEIWFYKI